jgi:AraC family transcriptional activator of mtrCDE
MSDVFSEIMRRVRLKACVYFERDFFAPWSMRMADTGFAQFHVITSGACVVEAAGASHNVSTGDILFFPHGLAHTLCDRAGRTPVNGPDFMASLASDQPMFTSGSQPTRMICGHYEYQWQLTHPLLSQLPEMVHISAAKFGPSPQIAALMPMILTELAEQRPGYGLIVEHFAEVLLVHTLRHHYQTHAPKIGFFGALNEPPLERAISHIHSEYAAPLTLADLAGAAGMSRSVFAKRFSDTVEMSPIDYLSQWRMAVAQELLRTTDHGVAEIADRVGYGSDIAFSRAYKRSFGLTPSASRKIAAE